MIKDQLGFHRPIQSVDLERCHRLGSPVEGQGRPRTVIVRFNSERLWDQVYRSRGMLIGYNGTNYPDKRIYLNEDLTTKRSKLVYKMRELKKAGQIMDCWTANGRAWDRLGNVLDSTPQAEYMPCPEKDQTIYIQEQEVKTVKIFKYMGSMFDAK